VDFDDTRVLELVVEIEEKAVVVADGTANKKNAVKLENLSLIWNLVVRFKSNFRWLTL